MSKIKPEIANRRIESFERRFGRPHLYLAYHAAFPLALTPNLLYRLWANFQRDIHGEVLGISWIGVGDLLLSSLCNEVGYELYEMDVVVRNLLLKRLREDEKFGQQRIKELSDFLLDYVRQQLQSDDPDIKDFAQAQQWTALAHTRPNEAAHELALAFSKLDERDKAELVRMASLIETFAEPLSKFPQLVIYARGIEKFARGNLEAAKTELSKVLERGKQIQVAGVNLPIPKQIRAAILEQSQPQIATNFKNLLKISKKRWLQVAVIALPSVALLVFLFFLVPVMDTRSVNSVRFSGIGLSVVSGSDDCTLRLWRIGADSLDPDDRVTYAGQPVACDQRQQPKGLMAITDEAVEVLRFMPLQNDRVAVGLDNGVIELREVPSGAKISQLQDLKDSKAKGDRVFDLAFTSNSLNLFSGYGSGKVRVWSRPAPNSDFLPEPQVIDVQSTLKLSGFQVRALNLSPDAKTLVIAGNFKRFILWLWNPNQSDKQSPALLVQNLEKLDPLVGREDYIWGLAFVPNSTRKILATSDSAGFITIWDLNQCQTIKNPNPLEKVNELNCSPLDRWSASKTSVRTLAFSDDGSLLVSGGDDGRVILWYLTSEHKLDKTKVAEGKTIYQSSKKINSIDLKTNQGTMIVSGGEDSQVKLHRIK